MLLLPEVLSPLRQTGAVSPEVRSLLAVLARLDLRPLDELTAQLATSLAASYGLRAAEAVHLATAVAAGADRFLTNNRKDFPRSIAEVEVTYPDDLPEP